MLPGNTCRVLCIYAYIQKAKRHATRTLKKRGGGHMLQPLEVGTFLSLVLLALEDRDRPKSRGLANLPSIHPIDEPTIQQLAISSLRHDNKQTITHHTTISGNKGRPTRSNYSQHAKSPSSPKQQQTTTAAPCIHQSVRQIIIDLLQRAQLPFCT